MSQVSFSEFGHFPPTDAFGFELSESESDWESRKEEEEEDQPPKQPQSFEPSQVIQLYLIFMPHQ